MCLTNAVTIEVDFRSFRYRDSSALDGLGRDSLGLEIVLNFSFFKDDAIGFVPVALPSPAFFVPAR